MKKLTIKSSRVKMILVIIVVSLLVAFVIYQKIDKNTTIKMVEGITGILETNRLNFLIYHIIIIAFLFLSVLLPFRHLIFIIYLFLELICINFNLIAFFSVYHLPGLLYSLLYIIITKGIYLILISIFYKLSYSTLTTVKDTLTSEPKSLMVYLNKRAHLLLGIILGLFLNDLVIYFLGNSILYKLCFILG